MADEGLQPGSPGLGTGVTAPPQTLRTTVAAARQRLGGSRFLKAVVLLSGGAAAGQALQLVATPVLSRLYQPDAYGVVAVYASIVGLVGVVASLRYELAIPLPKGAAQGWHLTILSALLVVASAIGLGAVMLVFGDAIVEATDAEALRGVLWLLPLMVLPVGLRNVANMWGLRGQVYHRIAFVWLVQPLIAVVAQIVLALLGFRSLGVLIGLCIGATAGTTILGWAVLRASPPPRQRPTLSDLRQVASRYRRFPMFTCWSALLETSTKLAPPILIAAFHGAGAAGAYVFAERIAWAPTSLLAQAMEQVFYGEASKTRHSAATEVSSLFRRILRTQLLVAAVLLVLFTVPAPRLVPIVFGSGWDQAATWLPIIALGGLAQFVAGSAHGLVDVLERQDLDLTAEAIAAASLLVAALLSWQLSTSATVTVTLFSLASVIGATAVVTFARRAVRQAGLAA